jgi:hypothetical protein
MKGDQVLNWGHEFNHSKGIEEQPTPFVSENEINADIEGCCTNGEREKCMMPID